MIHKPLCRLALFAILLFSLVFVTPVRAQTNLAQLLLKHETIQVYDKVFGNFRLYTSDVINADTASPSNIKAIPLDDDPLNPGILWNGSNGSVTTSSPPPAAEAGEWDVNGGGTQTTRFVYDVWTFSGEKRIKDNSLLMGLAGLIVPGEIR